MHEISHTRRQRSSVGYNFYVRILYFNSCFLKFSCWICVVVSSVSRCMNINNSVNRIYKYIENQLDMDDPECNKDELSEFIVPILKTSDEADELPNLNGDRANVVLLTFLYCMQGVVSGLSAAMPLLLQNYGATYTEQAYFSMAVWPFSMKLIWAPIIDSFYSKHFGRRKSWLIPTQYLIGVFMLLLSYYVKLWLTGDAKPNIKILTLLYFGLNFLAASLDITTDGWAIQLLKRCNIGYTATCNLLGQKSGFFIGFALFTILESAEFCNKYLRSTPQPTGMLTLSGYNKIGRLVQFLNVDQSN